MPERKVVIVTGAGSGIGESTAVFFAREGYKVIAAEIDESRGENVVKKIRKEGGEALFIPTDVRDEENINNLINSIVQTWGKINVLINNAGVSRFKSLYELSLAEWDDIININLRGYFLCARAAAKAMAGNGGGTIINIASTRAFMSEPNAEAYAASKGGIIALTHALAASLSPDNITVNSISPGWIETKNYEGLSPMEHSQHFSNRVGKPEDIARACLFLANGENSFINGTNLTIDGGMTKKMIYI
ncbi:MAG: 3-ketoacyl-ACP reductase [Clostridiaceae bacterium BRH_c20a]|nr:MAG: 3-ketoacyl-ACP reductase [Clostridiaceae bacterium BRH_c20a]